MANFGRVLRFVTGHPLTRKRPLAAVARFLAWQVCSRLFGVRTHAWIDGARLKIRPGMSGATGNVYCGLHEFVEMGFLIHLLTPGDIFLDVGANVGSYSILASKVCGAQSIAFEPAAEAANALRVNVVLNDLSERVTLHQAAVGDHDGFTPFTVGLDTMNRIAAASDEETQLVPVRKLDDVPGCEKAVLLKLDVEGYEMQVLAGAAKVLASERLIAVQSELQTPEVRRTLARFGFSQMYYDPFSREVSTEPLGLPVSNGLFIRNVDEVRSRVTAAPVRTILGQRL